VRRDGGVAFPLRRPHSHQEPRILLLECRSAAAAALLLLLLRLLLLLLWRRLLLLRLLRLVGRLGKVC
jgi:hypothetical protein